MVLSFFANMLQNLINFDQKMHFLLILRGMYNSRKVKQPSSPSSSFNSNKKMTAKCTNLMQSTINFYPNTHSDANDALSNNSIQNSEIEGMSFVKEDELQANAKEQLNLTENLDTDSVNWKKSLPSVFQLPSEFTLKKKSLFASDAEKSFLANKNDGSTCQDNSKSQYEFLEKIMDGNGLLPSDINYDPRTLHISMNTLSHMKPIENQYWNIKKQYFNYVVFFNKGKFFEMMELDADIGQRELGLNFTSRAGMKMCGIPVTSYNEAATKLLNRGYSICKVTQVNLNAEDSSKQDLIERRVECLVTPGTITDPMLLNFSNSKYLLCIIHDKSRIGMCVLDASSAKFWIDEFDYDLNYVKTVLFYFRPSELLFERSAVDDNIMKLLKLYSAENAKFTDRLKSDCWSEEKLEQVLLNDLKWWIPSYQSNTKNESTKINDTVLETVNSSCKGKEDFTQSDCNMVEQVKIEKFWPNVLKLLRNHKMAMQGLGTCLCYLQELDISYVFASGSFYNLSIEKNDCIFQGQSCHLKLDSNVLANLNVLENEEHNTKGTILELLDYTTTSFGKKLFKKWVSYPLCSVQQITARQNSIEFLIEKHNFRKILQNSLRNLPDLERLLLRSISCRIEPLTFYKLIEGLHVMTNMFQALVRDLETLENNNSIRILSLVTIANCELYSTDVSADAQAIDSSGCMSELSSVRTTSVVDDLEWIRKNLKINKDDISPPPGFDAVYDEILERIDSYKIELDELVKSYSQKYFGGSAEIQLTDVGNTRCLLEVPKSLLNKYSLPEEFKEIYKRTTSKLKRYSTAELLKIIPKIEAAEFELKLAKREIFETFLKNFNYNFKKWQLLVSIAGECDCLLSLMSASQANPEIQCKPIFYERGFCSETQSDIVSNDTVSESVKHAEFYPFIDIKSVVHPCLMKNDSNFVPNDISMGYMPQCLQKDNNYGKTLILLKGPNMGGKSTVLRQICVAIILAQIGCWVYAKSFHLTCFDRIFSRIGASDNIIEGKSTFLAELEETSVILNNATSKSFVILDELGRGTSTFDGYSIAYSVMKHLSLTRKCCTIFSTHYHMLSNEVSMNTQLSLHVDVYHMDVFLDEQEGQVVKVTFLYKMVKKSLLSESKSYGLTIASMAGLPDCVLETARIKSKSFEEDQIKTYNLIVARNNAIAKLKLFIKKIASVDKN